MAELNWLEAETHTTSSQGCLWQSGEQSLPTRNTSLKYCGSLRPMHHRQSFYLFDKYLMLGMGLSDWTCIQGGHSPELIFNNKNYYNKYLRGIHTRLMESERRSDTCSRCRSVTSQARETIRAKLRACSDFVRYRYHLPISSGGGWRQMMRGRKTEQQQVPGGFRESLNLSWNFFYSYYQMRTRNGKESWDKSYK